MDIHIHGKPEFATEKKQLCLKALYQVYTLFV